MKKWKVVLALAIIYIALLMEWNWVWGVLFLSWMIPSLYSGKTYLVEEIDRKENPFLFWIVMVTWLCLALWLIIVDILSVVG